MNFIQVLNAVLMFKVVCLSSYFRASKIIEKQLQLTFRIQAKGLYKSWFIVQVYMALCM